MEENLREPTPPSPEQTPVELLQIKLSREEPGFQAWFSGWVSLLATVFLAGATCNSLFHWLPYGHPWDLGGTIFSGVLAWACYSLTVSERATPIHPRRMTLAFVLVIFWMAFFPAIMWALGFK